MYKILLRLRPRAVQSVRYGQKGFFVDRAVRLWKQKVVEQLRAYAPARPSDGPVRILKLVYGFKMPAQPSQNTDKLCRLFEAINHKKVAGGTKRARLEELTRLVCAGEGELPYLACADLTDNLNKGLVDCLSGIFFTDDRLIWQLTDSKKVYGSEDYIYIEMRTSEMP